MEINDWSVFDRYKLMTSIGVVSRKYVRVLSMEEWNGMEIGAVIDKSIIDWGSILGKTVSRIG